MGPKIRWTCLLGLFLGLATVTTPNGLEGRWKIAGDGTCYWDDDDSGPDQCTVAPYAPLTK